MDQKEMMERLKRDPAALQAVMGSRDGQMLLGLLSGSDGGRTLQQAVRGVKSFMNQPSAILGIRDQAVVDSDHRQPGSRPACPLGQGDRMFSLPAFHPEQILDSAVEHPGQAQRHHRIRHITA